VSLENELELPDNNKEKRCEFYTCVHYCLRNNMHTLCTAETTHFESSVRSDSQQARFSHQGNSEVKVNVQLVNAQYCNIYDGDT